MNNKKYYWSLILIFALVSCTYEFPEEDLFIEHTGDINVEKIISFGDGYLAGVMDGALYNNGQINSIASQIVSNVNGVEEVQFIQPEIQSENGFNFYASTENEIFGKWIYRFQNQTDEKPIVVSTSGEQIKNYVGDKNLLNDLTVPLLKVGDLGNPQFDKNPFLNRVFQNNNSTLIEQFVSYSPSFTIAWMGMNDILNFAMNGATISADLTSVEIFQANMDLFIENFLQNTSGKMVIGNLISIKDLPFFYINQYNFIRLPNSEKSAAQAWYSDFNNAVASHNVGLPPEQKRPFISFEDNGATLYPQSVVVIDENLPDAFYANGTTLEKYRQLTEGEMALFSITSGMVENGLGSLYPISQEYYLSHNQITLIEERLTEFNQIISNSVQNNSERIAIADVKYAVKRVAETGNINSWGIPVVDETIYSEGVPLEGGLDLNSIFSLDAVHFNQRGGAYVSNVFIEAINSEFNANIPMTIINDYIGNVYEF